MPLSGAFRIFLAGTAGTLIAALLEFVPGLPRGSVFERTLPPEGPGLVGYLFRLQNFLTSPYVIVPWFLVMIYLAISRREEPKSWFYAFLAGCSLSSVMFHYVLHWT